LALLVGGLAVAAEPAGPATRPAEGWGKVLILPMTRISADQAGQQADWIARAVQQSLVAEVARTTAAQPLAPAKAAAVSDPVGAVLAGREAGARYVVFGSYQVLESDLRITAQVMDVESGYVAGALKATRSLRELFSMEDTLGSQLARILPRREGDAMAVASATGPTAPAVAPEGAVRVGASFDGSGLQRSIYEPAPMAGDYGNGYDRYMYNPPVYPYYPSYGYSYGGYPYSYGFGYYPYYSPYCGFGSRLTVVINPNHHDGQHNPTPTPTPPGMTPSNPGPVVTPHPSMPHGSPIGFRPPMQPMRPVGPAPGPPVRPQSVGGTIAVRGGK
jgi:TolB-like protein